jgi:hypothetical protein
MHSSSNPPPRSVALAAGVLAALGLADPGTLAQVTGLPAAVIGETAQALTADPQATMLEARARFFSPKAAER